MTTTNSFALLGFLLGLARLFLPAASMAGGRLSFEVLPVLTDLLQAIGPALQLHRQLITPLALDVLAILLGNRCAEALLSLDSGQIWGRLWRTLGAVYAQQALRARL